MPVAAPLTTRGNRARVHSSRGLANEYVSKGFKREELHCRTACQLLPDRLLVTGYGRGLAEVEFGIESITEIKAHARGALALAPGCRSMNGSSKMIMGRSLAKRCPFASTLLRCAPPEGWRWNCLWSGGMPSGRSRICQSRGKACPPTRQKLQIYFLMKKSASRPYRRGNRGW